jgi:hypothetical protein
MSIRYIAAVLDRLTHLTPSETLVLVALADNASDDRRLAWPSMASICRRSRLSRRGAQKILRRLEERGLIDIATGGQHEGANLTNHYRLRFTYDGERMETADKLSTGGANGVRPGGRTGFAPGANGVRPGGERGSPRGANRVRTNRHRNRHRTVIEPKSDLKKSPVNNSDPEMRKASESLVNLLARLQADRDKPE